MMADELENRQILETLLDDLDRQARLAAVSEPEDEKWACQRRAPRREFRMPCTVRFLSGEALNVIALTGRTRNISTSGVGFIVRRVFAVGSAVELELTPEGRPRIFLGGIVAFCRYAGQGYCEVGLELKAADSKPIFTRNPIAAMQVLYWLQTTGGIA